jgi:hypothetical protein
MDDRSAEVTIVVTSHGTWTWIVVVVDVDRRPSTVEVPHDLRRLWKPASAIVGKLEPHCR